MRAHDGAVGNVEWLCAGRDDFSLDDGFARLAGTAASLGTRDPEALADELLIGMLAEDGDDDVAIVVYRQP